MTRFSFCSNGATDCDDGIGNGIAQACNSEDLDFCEMDGCCDNIDSPCPYAYSYIEQKT